MSKIVVLGAGRFGRNAARRLSKKKPNRVAVVDADPAKCAAATVEGLESVHAEGIAYLASCLQDPDPPDWIIPAIPVHVAFEWLHMSLPEERHLDPLPIPEQVRGLLPNPLEGAGGQLYMSHADFICPPDCPEPANVCTYTGKARKGILQQALARIQFEDYLSVVVHSRQMAPGLGGIRSEDLFATQRRVLAASGPILLSTACKCHGVLHAFRIT